QSSPSATPHQNHRAFCSTPPIAPPPLNTSLFWSLPPTAELPETSKLPERVPPPRELPARETSSGDSTFHLLPLPERSLAFPCGWGRRRGGGFMSGSGGCLRGWSSWGRQGAAISYNIFFDFPRKERERKSVTANFAGGYPFDELDSSRCCSGFDEVVFITGGVDRKVNLWAIGQPTALLSLSGHTSSVESVTFDSAEVLVLAGAYSGTIKLWDLEEAKLVRTLTGHRSSCTSVEFHPFGEFFASGSLDTDLKIWDIRRKGCIHTYQGHTRAIKTIKFTPDGRWVVSGGEDNVIKLWDLTAGKLLHEFKFHTGPIQSIDFHPHEFLLATGSADRTVKFWDLETFELIGSTGPEVTGVRSMIFHPDGKALFCGLDETLKVFSWEPIRCHDIVDMRWSILGDLSIYEGKLLGCSYHQSSVGVWVADISLIAPYANGVVPRASGLTEPTCSPGEDHAFHYSSFESNTIVIDKVQDCEGETKETIKSVYMACKFTHTKVIWHCGTSTSFITQHI
ncbi:hypothetical protein Taro_012562, partial [Colocasia esculenta]|nr:hypothetical protein [Colocasia esculenta]